MTAPKRDGRPMLERARECAKLWGYEAHDRSDEVADALRAVMPVVEAAIEAERYLAHLGMTLPPPIAAAIGKVREPRCTYTSGKPIRRRGLKWITR